MIPTCGALQATKGSRSPSLLMDFYELTMAQSYFVYRKNSFATFDLFVRDLPPHRSYLVAAGLEDILRYVKTFSFDSSSLCYLRAQKIFSKRFLEYLSRFKFTGDIWAMREGEICFANEPVVRVTAPIIEAQILESFLLNTINLQTMIASKASRVVIAAAERAVFDFSLRRTHGQDAGVKVARSAYLAGASGTSCVLAGKCYAIPVVGTMAHAYVMSFKDELESFAAYSKIFPDKTILLVDTYDSKKGITNAVTIGLRLKEKGHRLLGIRLDSGDIVALSRFARSAFDRAGLSYVKIYASGNLDEYKIKTLLSRGAKVDCFGVGTNMGTSSDAPSLDVIYKISEITDETGRFIPTMKLSKGKVTYPGRKQVYRIKDKKGMYVRDILGLENERINGTPLLRRVIRKGKIIYRVPSLEGIRSFSRNELTRFSRALTDISSTYRYPVCASPGLAKVRAELSRRLEKRQ